MAVLLARTADRLLWGARYVERAEDTARVVRAYNELVVDYPSQELLSWEPLAAIHGSSEHVKLAEDDPSGERSVLTLLISDRENPSSILSSVASARENLRTTREVMPREAWQAVNQLSQYVDATATAAVERQLRDRFLLRVIEVSRRLDGILESTMSRGSSYRMLRLGRLIERADMTTRVLGVAAAGILLGEDNDADEVVPSQIRWMSVLRSVSALQMYQRSDHGPIDGLAVVRFLLYWESFPRSVQGCLDEIRAVVNKLPRPDAVLDAVSRAEAVLAGADPGNADAERLDRSMDQVQVAISELAQAVHATYVDSAL
jgi:uncharacterized alpha-E superfamily protein